MPGIIGNEGNIQSFHEVHDEDECFGRMMLKYTDTI
jgi:hypothetical protein